MTGCLHYLKTLPLIALIAQVVSATELTRPELICGPDIVTIGDAWEKVQRQMLAARQILETGNAQQIPQKFSAVMIHLRFMQKGALMIYGKRRTQIDRSVSVLDALVTGVNTAALTGENSIALARFEELETTVKHIGSQFPDEALLPSASFAHLLPPIEPILHIQLEPSPDLQPNRPLRVTFQLVRKKDIKPVGAEDLIATHGATLHALICDRTLTDYHHEHPTPTGRPGEWELSFTPRQDDEYHLWINAVPTETGREEFPVNTISLANPNLVPLAPVWKAEATARTGDLHANLIWSKDEKLAADRPASGTIHVTDNDGKPVQDLEPYMGAFAHIVGIADDFHTVFHAHPDGANSEPLKLGGPDLSFTIRPPRPGFYRLFVQVMHHGQVQTLPFGIIVPPVGG